LTSAFDIGSKRCLGQTCLGPAQKRNNNLRRLIRSCNSATGKISGRDGARVVAFNPQTADFITRSLIIGSLMARRWFIDANEHGRARENIVPSLNRDHLR